MSDLGRFLERAMIDFMHIADPFGIVAARKALNEAGVKTVVDRGREWWMLYGGFTKVVLAQGSNQALAGEEKTGASDV